MLFPMRTASLFYNITHHCAVVRLKEGGCANLLMEHYGHTIASSTDGNQRGKEEGFEQDDERIE